jgi:hypothetical protein
LPAQAVQPPWSFALTQLEKNQKFTKIVILDVFLPKFTTRLVEIFEDGLDFLYSLFEKRRAMATWLI